MSKLSATLFSLIIASITISLSSFSTSDLEGHKAEAEGRGKEGKIISINTPDGKKTNAYILSAKVPSSNYLFVFHEWWGLDANIKTQAQKYYSDLEGITVIALDLYDGTIAKNEEEAAELMRGVSKARAESIIKGAMAYVGEDAEVSTLGWSFGGSWALKASILLGEQADGCVMYYGMPEKKVEKLSKLQTTVLGFFAKNDNWVTSKIVNQFSQNMKAANKTLELTSFQADHGFANPNDKRFDKLVATKAHTASVKYLKERIEN